MNINEIRLINRLAMKTHLLIAAVMLTGCTRHASTPAVDSQASNPGQNPIVSVFQEMTAAATNSIVGIKREQTYDPGRNHMALKSINVSQCPADFQTAFADFSATVQDWSQPSKAAMGRTAVGFANGQRLDMLATLYASGPNDATATAWSNLLAAAAKHGVGYPLPR